MVTTYWLPGHANNTHFINLSGQITLIAVFSYDIVINFREKVVIKTHKSTTRKGTTNT
jgi:hypothetical protein